MDGRDNSTTDSDFVQWQHRQASDFGHKKPTEVSPGLESPFLFDVFQVTVDALELFDQLGLEAIISGRLDARLEFFGLVAAAATTTDLTVTFNSHCYASF